MKDTPRILKLFFIIIAGLCLGAGILGIRLYNEFRHHEIKETRVMMDTFVTIHAIGPKQMTSRGVTLAFNRLQEIGVKFNSLDPRSPVYAFNHQGMPISDPEIIHLISLGLKVSKESEGAFDITVAPLVELWGFYQKMARLPKAKEIKQALKKVGYQHLSVKNGKLVKDNKGTRIDLGGIAKGYAISEAVKILKQGGVTSALIDAGGDIYVLGKKGGKPWRIGIRDPRKDGLLGYVEVEDCAVMGSGDYERFFVKEGKRYHHIFNPKTGYPTEGVAAVTLIYHDPVLAQAWSKIPFVMGAQKGMERLGQIPGMGVILVTDQGEALYSPGLERLIKR